MLKNYLYTPGLPATKPDKYSSDIYLNTPDIRVYSKGEQADAYALNLQHRNAADNFSIKGFEIIIKGRAMIISNGVCLLKRGETAKIFYHGESTFYLPESIDFPLQKPITYYLAINRTNYTHGKAVLFLFSNKRDITHDWLVLKQIHIPSGANDLSSISVTSCHADDIVSVYNYMPAQPDGITSLFILPFKISPGSVKIFINGDNITGFTADYKQSHCEVKINQAPAAGTSLIADFALLI